MSTVVLPGQRATVSRDGRGLETVLPSAATGGTVSVIDCHIPAGSTGPPLHIHPASDETFVVLSGTLLVHLDGELHEIPEGGLVHVSRGTPHTFATPPGSGAHFLTLHTPGGFEEFHAAAAKAAREAGRQLSTGELAQLAQDYDWQFAGPPLLPSGVLVLAPVTA